MFVCKREDSLQYHGGVRSRELGQVETPYLDVLKKVILELNYRITNEISYPTELSLWRTGMLLLIKLKDHKSNTIALGTPGKP